MNLNSGKNNSNSKSDLLIKDSKNIISIIKRYFPNEIQEDLFIKTNDEGFTFLEIILIAIVFGTISSIAVPQFEPIINKFRQKEATGIVNSMIKSAQSNYALLARLPEDMGEVSKYATFKKCNVNNAESKGASACKNTRPVTVGKEILFYSPTGRYKVEMRKINTNDGRPIYQVKANPNGENYINEGSAVVGCYNPTGGITYIKEYSAKKAGKGVKPFVNCETPPPTSGIGDGIGIGGIGIDGIGIDYGDDIGIDYGDDIGIDYGDDIGIDYGDDIGIDNGLGQGRVLGQGQEQRTTFNREEDEDINESRRDFSIDSQSDERIPRQQTSQSEIKSETKESPDSESYPSPVPPWIK